MDADDERIAVELSLPALFPCAHLSEPLQVPFGKLGAIAVSFPIPARPRTTTSQPRCHRFEELEDAEDDLVP